MIFSLLFIHFCVAVITLRLFVFVSFSFFFHLASAFLRLLLSRSCQSPDAGTAGGGGRAAVPLASRWPASGGAALHHLFFLPPARTRTQWPLPSRSPSPSPAPARSPVAAAAGVGGHAAAPLTGPRPSDGGASLHQFPSPFPCADAYAAAAEDEREQRWETSASSGSIIATPSWGQVAAVSRLCLGALLCRRARMRAGGVILLLPCFSIGGARTGRIGDGGVPASASVAALLRRRQNPWHESVSASARVRAGSASTQAVAELRFSAPLGRVLERRVWGRGEGGHAEERHGRGREAAQRGHQRGQEGGRGGE
ncbi:hypothetical protein BS78_10G081300 [Paspalum vaginatum]|nr:hypothetical protein BS78_10G081300 [Paspalum vaginatum]